MKSAWKLQKNIKIFFNGKIVVNDIEIISHKLKIRLELKNKGK